MPPNVPAGDQHVETSVPVADPRESLSPVTFQGSARLPWRPLGVAIAAGSPVGIGVLHPVLGEAITVIETVVALTIIATALFGSTELSERAFRFLRWLRNQPEPPKPGE